MSKLGRNDSCHCGSGRKYKKCCLAADEVAGITMPPTETGRSDFFELMASFDGWDGLEAAANSVTDLIQEKRLDEAEKAAHEFLERYPSIHDGYDYIGRVYEARGENLKAADYYRKAAAFIRAHPDHYELGFEEVFDQLVDKLDPFGLSRSDVADEVSKGTTWPGEIDLAPEAMYAEIKANGQ